MLANDVLDQAVRWFGRADQLGGGSGPDEGRLATTSRQVWSRRFLRLQASSLWASRVKASSTWILTMPNTSKNFCPMDRTKA